MTKHSCIMYQNTHNLIDLRTIKIGYFSVYFIGSFITFNILDILPLAARLWLSSNHFDGLQYSLNSNLDIKLWGMGMDYLFNVFFL